MRNISRGSISTFFCPIFPREILHYSTNIGLPHSMFVLVDLEMWFFRASNTRTTMMTGQQPEKQMPTIAHLNVLGQEGVIFAHQTQHFFVAISHLPLPTPLSSFLTFKGSPVPAGKRCFLLRDLLPKTALGLCLLSSCFNFSSFHFLHPSPQLCSSCESQSWPQCCSSPAGCLCPGAVQTQSSPISTPDPISSQHTFVLKKILTWVWKTKFWWRHKSWS